MFIIPVERKIDWKNPPVITLLLILVNVLIFLGFQMDEDKYLEEALSYYFESDLPKIEFPLYINYQEHQHDLSEKDRLEVPAQDDLEAQVSFFYAMDADAVFMHKLRADELVTPGSKDYPEWRLQRSKFEALMRQVTSYEYGLKPAEPTVLTLFSNMFLHGGWDHLLGNMLVLLIIGFVVEATLGKFTYLVTYLLSGLLSGGLYIAFNTTSNIPSIGASGAIAGVMGMYLMLFGMRKIKFFYSLLFYFDYIKAPAIILLPIWLANEFYPLLLGEDTGVNHYAHIGGCAGGALLAFIAKKFLPSVDTGYLEQAERDNAYTQRYDKALQLMAKMELAPARKLFLELQQIKPDDRSILVHLYNIAKFNPASDEYHALSHDIFLLAGRTAETVKLQNDTYKEYLRIAKPSVRLKPEQLLSLAGQFTAGGYLDDAEKLIGILVKSKWSSHQLPQAILLLANKFNISHKLEKQQHYLSLLIAQFPDSTEVASARRVMTGDTKKVSPLAQDNR